jgi:hypothetical protein
MTKTVVKRYYRILIATIKRHHLISSESVEGGYSQASRYYVTQKNL